MKAQLKMSVQDPIYHRPTQGQAAQRTRPSRVFHNAVGDRRRKQILEFIVAHQLQFGFAPSIREIGMEVGLESSSTVHSHLTALERAGKIRRNRSSPRSIEIILGPGLFSVNLRGSFEDFKGLEKILGDSIREKCEFSEAAGRFLEQIAHLTNGTAVTYPDIARSSLPGSNGADK